MAGEVLKPRQCPVCGAMLQPSQTAIIIQCESCGQELIMGSAHRCLIVSLAAVLSWAIPALLARNPAVSPLMFIFFFFPGLPLAAQLVTKILGPKYQRRGSPFTTLFRR